MCSDTELVCRKKWREHWWEATQHGKADRQQESDNYLSQND